MTKSMGFCAGGEREEREKERDIEREREREREREEKEKKAEKKKRLGCEKWQIIQRTRFRVLKDFLANGDYYATTSRRFFTQT